MKIGPIASYVCGAIISLIVFITISILFGGLENPSQEEDGFIGDLIAIIIGIGVFFTGFDINKRVSVNHEAVLIIIGMRVPIILTEGWIWTIPGLMSFMEFDVREKNIIIGDDGQLQVIAIDPKTGRAVEMTTKIVIRFIINNVWRFIKIGEDTMESNLVELSKSALRGYSGNTDFRTLITDKDDIGSEIQNTFMYELAAVTAGWGIQVLGLTLAKVVPKDEEFLRALEMEAREEEEGQGEDKEVEWMLKQINRIATELDCTKVEARRIFQIQQGKAEAVFYEGLERAGVKPMIPLKQPTKKKKQPTTQEGGSEE